MENERMIEGRGKYLIKSEGLTLVSWVVLFPLLE
jgi:hypothetical protein